MCSISQLVRTKADFFISETCGQRQWHFQWVLRHECRPCRWSGWLIHPNESHLITSRVVPGISDTMALFIQSRHSIKLICLRWAFRQSQFGYRSWWRFRIEGNRLTADKTLQSCDHVSQIITLGKFNIFFTKVQLNSTNEAKWISSWRSSSSSFWSRPAFDAWPICARFHFGMDQIGNSLGLR